MEKKVKGAKVSLPEFHKSIIFMSIEVKSNFASFADWLTIPMPFCQRGASKSTTIKIRHNFL